MFETDLGFVVAGEAVDGAQAIEQVLATRPDLVLMDLQMPVLDGVAAIAAIRRLPNPPPVLVLTTFDSDAQILHAIEAGATGYLLKDTPRETLFAAVRSAVAGGSPLAPSVAARLMRRLAPGPGAEGEALSGRELEVVALVAQGASNKEIAHALHISEATIKTHLAHIFEKLDVTDRTSAVTRAIERGLIELPRR